MRTRCLMAVLASVAFVLAGATAAAAGGQAASPAGKAGGHAENRSARVAHLYGKKTSGAECPSGLTCQFLPAAYAQNSADPSDYGNSDLAHSPTDGLVIRYIVVHDAEVPDVPKSDKLQGTHAYVSAH